MLIITLLLLLLFVALAIFPPRLHFGLRFLALLVLGGVMVGIGILAPDFMVPAPPPLDEQIGDLNLVLLGVLGFALGLPVAIVAWIVRKVAHRSV